MGVPSAEPAAPAPDRAGAPQAERQDGAELAELLERFRLTKFGPALEAMGVESLEDFAYLQEADLEKLGMPLIPRRKLLEACGGQWRTGAPAAAPAAEAAAAGAAPAPAAPVQPQEVVERAVVQAAPPAAVPDGTSDGAAERPAAGDDVEGDEEEFADHDSELAEMLANLELFIEDFVSANVLDDESWAALTDIPPVAALRAMGLIGKGNAFVMKGVRKPGPAVLSRTRAAVSEVNRSSGLPSSVPYEEWPRLLESFCEANGLCEDACTSARSLGRKQALRVMGFTSGLSFVVPAAGGQHLAEAEVAARLRAARASEPMPAVLPRKGRAARLGRPALPAQARTSMPPLPPRDRPRSRSREGRQADRWQDRRHAGGRRHGGVDGEVAPFWRRNIETFIELNDLDERSVQVMNDLPKLVALQVMGLAGRENSFIIRGAKNPSAAVMHRVQKAQEGYGGDEPFAQLHKLVEDFISVNDFDDRGLEAVRTLRPEVAMHVMGFTAENAFVIKGVNNPSAALIARIAGAQRFL